jgi:hypothetical protein
MQERLVLEEIEMPPLLHRGVVHGTIGLGAVRAREAPASEEVDLDVEPLARGVERARLDLPSWRSRALHGRGTSPRANWTRSVSRMTGTPTPELPPSCRRAPGRQAVAWKRRARRNACVPASPDDHSARRRPGMAGRGEGMVFDRTKGWDGQPKD